MASPAPDRAAAEPRSALDLAAVEGRPDTARERMPLSEWNRRIEVLERAPVFFTLPAATLRATARRLRPIELRAGAVAINQGEVVDSVLIVESGRMALRVEETPGRTITVGLLGPGELFGESGCLAQEPSPAAMVAVEDTRVLALDRQSLEQLLADEPDAVAGLQRLGDQRVRTFPALVVTAGRDQGTDLAEVVAVYSAKGGSGKTTIALNLAAELARSHPGQVLLVDLALPFNHAALLANLVPSGSLARVVAARPERLDEALLGAVLYHSSGMLMLPGTLKAEEADALQPQHVHAALDILRTAFRYIVIDLSTSLDDITLAALEESQRLVLVTTPELATLHGASELGEILSIAVGVPPEAITMVLNQRSPKTALSREAVARAIEREIDVEVRHDGVRADEAALRGVLSHDDPKSEITIGARSLADLIESARPRRGGD
ncbi:MAG TPA: cyclic nucleotide-binding domain-containing protein [Candidatus Dormibacteraeota bacterium]